MELQTVLLNWPESHEAMDAFCLVGSKPGLDRCFRFDVLDDGGMQAVLHIAPGTYEIKVSVLNRCLWAPCFYLTPLLSCSSFFVTANSVLAQIYLPSTLGTAR